MILIQLHVVISARECYFIHSDFKKEVVKFFFGKMSLTAEQLERIARNKAEAKRRMAERQQRDASRQPSTSNGTTLYIVVESLIL